MTKQDLVKQLYTVEGFQARFEEKLRSITKSNSDAYEAVEVEYEALFGKRRYVSYNSFAVIRSRHLKQKRHAK